MNFLAIFSFGSEPVAQVNCYTSGNNSFGAAASMAAAMLFENKDADNVIAKAIIDGRVADDNFFYAEKG